LDDRVSHTSSRDECVCEPLYIPLRRKLKTSASINSITAIIKEGEQGKILELEAETEQETTEVGSNESHKRERKAGSYFFCRADSMNALVSLRTSASFPRNK
jgi:hypothetical protein